MQKYRYFYLRNSYTPCHRGAPIGCIVSEIDNKNNVVHYSFSVAHKHADEFRKSTGRELALGRLVSGKAISFDITGLTSNHDIHRAIMNDIASAPEQYFPSRVRKAAKRWISESLNRKFDDEA